MNFYFRLLILIFLCPILLMITHFTVNSVEDTIYLGDSVRTTDEYNSCFNDSFKGRIISSETYMYTVRDTQGYEKTFDRTWLVKTEESTNITNIILSHNHTSVNTCIITQHNNSKIITPLETLNRFLINDTIDEHIYILNGENMYTCVNFATDLS